MTRSGAFSLRVLADDKGASKPTYGGELIRFRAALAGSFAGSTSAYVAVESANSWLAELRALDLAPPFTTNKLSGGFDLKSYFALTVYRQRPGGELFVRDGILFADLELSAPGVGTSPNHLLATLAVSQTELEAFHIALELALLRRVGEPAILRGKMA